MIKAMFAKYPGIDSRTGHRIRVGDQIKFDTVTRKSWIHERSDEQPVSDASAHNRVSNHFVIGGNDYFRNKAGRCEDAPCCGCCTI